MARQGDNIYQWKDGRYEGRYVVGRENGRTQFGYVYGQDYAQVQRELALRRAQAEGGGPTLEQWVTRWLAGEVCWRVKPSTSETYQRHWACYVQPWLGQARVQAISPDDVRGMLAQLHGRGLSAGTARCALRLLSAAMDGAVQDGLISRNPCRKVRVASTPAAEQRVLTREEQQRLRACAEDEPAVLLALYTGMRLGEVCGLMWQDVDWQERTLTVRRTVQRLKGGLTEGTPKSAKSHRVIPLPQFLAAQLWRRHAEQAGGYVFGTGDRAEEPRNLQRRFERLTARCGLEGVHFHTLRHTFATRMIELGVDVKTVSTLLGHSSTQITLDLYAHSLIDQQRQAMDRLEALARQEAGA